MLRLRAAEFFCLLHLFADVSNAALTITQIASPGNVSRDKTWYEWCDCHKGLNSLVVWPDDDHSEAVTISMSRSQTLLAHVWIKFPRAAKKISWKCDGGMAAASSNVKVAENQWLDLLFFIQEKDGFLDACRKDTGRLHFNLWSPTPHVSSVPFVTGTEGYACFKIPSMLATQAGSLLAFVEARTPGCDDFDRTEVVYKRSTDGGRSWGPLQKLVEPGAAAVGECGKALVIGNIAPVQLRTNSKKYPGRILVPYTRNNFKHFLVHSDDDGVSFQGDRELAGTSVTDEHPDCNRSMSSYFGFKIDRVRLSNIKDISKWLGELCAAGSPYHNPQWSSKLNGSWQFLGLGPPGSLQLQSGRVLVPGYHAYIRGLDAGHGTLPVSQLYNNFAVGHTLISDDDGDTWRLGKAWPTGEGFDENQYVELADGSVLANGRSLSTGSRQMRLQAISQDGGETFQPSKFVPEIPEPFNGCQGSTLGPGGPSNEVYVANPDPQAAESIVADFTRGLGCNLNLTGRARVTVWRSTDGGRTYPRKQLVDAGLSAQTSLQFRSGKLMLMYEQADPVADSPSDILMKYLVQNLKILLPTRIIVREIPLDAFEAAETSGTVFV
eukprot:TRINITY_DN26849_c0_g1_i1.p1 TRINITY_DN26849_c0_g1~~TRINITY_DN26849_c0_g1_i1.p1  ORF type:complete len:607 (+),score=67.53 TRINITY_DN26849_c0_g1_i1:40-1860(+)